MKLGTYVCVAIDELRKHDILDGKTNIQKIIYFALPEENRDQFYQPYYYGPYSADVQQTIFSLLRKEDAKDIKQLRIDTESSLCRPEDDSIVKRLRLTADFFTKNKITTTGDISFLAKVHLLNNTKREEAKNNLAEYIQNQARFLGWKELATATLEKIQSNISLAKSLEEALEC
jgi:uncharacterized protein YwgA